jgi:hypothetical protein
VQALMNHQQTTTITARPNQPKQNPSPKQMKPTTKAPYLMKFAITRGTIVVNFD